MEKFDISGEGERVIFDKFKLVATPQIIDAYCECGGTMQEVFNSLLSRAMFCPKCENVYMLKLVRVAKKFISAEFLKQARSEVAQ